MTLALDKPTITQTHTAIRGFMTRRTILASHTEGEGVGYCSLSCK